MASYTTNLNLKKPAGGENVNIADINGNMDLIDTAYNNLKAFTYSGTLPGGTDLNSVLTPGTYRMVSGGLYSNIPSTDSYQLLVIRSESTSRLVTQITFGVVSTFFRVKGDSAWNPWIRLDPCGNGWLSDCDLDSVLTPGVYGLSSTNTYQHAPIANIGGIFEVIKPSNSDTYVIQKIIGSSYIYVRYRSQSGGTAWTGWYKYTGTAV